ncbi:DUF5704 domain-containing protein [Paenibacillus sp. A3M_27_13]|uniref:DUF5704 domain-containing protein n=1 Tax=Paenibacillus sp. A3M_27_13 TaxID=2962029 RepID=UPI0020B73156|nr:DUF5704 domain-containing protein [Paenibacillus sp. A3M_27_13]MCP3744125.1 DUF5704 domain-containing protein [Paenibacillus sp. A3M_27_13]
MKNTKRILAVLLVGVLLLLQLSPFSFPTDKVAADSEEITPLSYYPDKNARYFVGMMYFDMWMNTAGKWVTDGGKEPGKGMHGEAKFTYKFNFPGRKIKSVEAKLYNPAAEVNKNNPDYKKYFSKSRFDDYIEYVDYVSDGTKEDDILPYQIKGVGTDTTIIPITVNIKLDAITQPKNIKEESCPNCAKEVEAYRIYQPILFKIELESSLIVKHFTTDGKSLNNVFTPIEDELKADQPYDFTPPTNPKYEYVGYKKSTTGKPPSGDILPGIVPGFTYDGSFEQFTAYLYYKEAQGCPKPGESQEGAPSDCQDNEQPTKGVVCSRPVPGLRLETAELDPTVSAVIKADQRGRERFDVSKGIPTSESLYGHVQAKRYLFQHKFVNMTGQCTYTVNVKREYRLTWRPKKKSRRSETVKRTYTYQIVRPYSYWTIDNLEVYGIKEATLRNYALPNETITLRPQSYTPPSYIAATQGNFYPPPAPGTVDGGSRSKNGGSSKPSVPDDRSALKSKAEGAVKEIEVENDTLTFENKIIMNPVRVKVNGPRPGVIPSSGAIGPDVLYSPDHVIDKYKINKSNTPSSGDITYAILKGNINGGADKTFPIQGINTVTVHTPVVNLSKVSDDAAHNQKTQPTKGRSALILERPFRVTISTAGPHLNIPGYGDREYAKYVRTKQVRFPFDVYDKGKTQFYPRGTWIDIPVQQLDTDFYLPVWVDEGKYTVEFRTIAENAPDGFTEQRHANTDIAHHVANDVVNIEVIGRMYDFHITDIADYHWERVFRQRKGSPTHSGLSYWTGLGNIGGLPRGNPEPFTLPVRPGSHPYEGYANVAVKTGYHFKFDLKTKGNMFSAKDGIRITPSFYWVSKDGRQREEVDLYTHSGSRKFIRLGSAEDREKRYVILNERLRNVPMEEMQDTSAYQYKHELSEAQQSQLTLERYVSLYAHRIARSKTWIGRYDWLVLPAAVRTLIGPKTDLPDGVNVDRANASIQRWYGEYSLPADVYAVTKGTDLREVSRRQELNEHTDIFKKTGFIVVNFNVESLRQGDTEHPHLQYINGPLLNQWQLEGYRREIKDPYGHIFHLQDGDVVFYHADQSSRDDFSSFVPH